MRRLIATLALCSVLSAPAFGWGAQGHRVISRVAMARLTPNAAAEVKALLDEGDTLVDICLWADGEGKRVVPGSASWHYVDVPISEAHYDDKFCPETGCVVSKIKHYRGVLADKTASRADRQVALKMLVHFIEDLHQPLHVGDNHDRGGNDTQVRFGDRGTNMHRLWDTDMIAKVGGDDAAWAGRITPLLTPENVKAWSSPKVEDWAEESFQAARTAYAWPEGATAPIRPGTRLGDDYLAKMDPIVRERLARASVRLANELNALFP